MYKNFVPKEIQDFSRQSFGPFLARIPSFLTKVKETKKKSLKLIFKLNFGLLFIFHEIKYIYFLKEFSL